MRKIIYAILLSTMVCSCTSNDSSLPVPSIDGAIFVQSSYVIETPIDVNGDGIFSNDIYGETACATDPLRFNTGETVWNPSFSVVSLRIFDDGNGNPTQSAICNHFDGTFPNYIQKDEIVEFFYSDDIIFTGTLSDDGNTLTFNFPNELLYLFNSSSALSANEILNPDGSISEYEGSAKVIYTRQ